MPTTLLRSVLPLLLLGLLGSCSVYDHIFHPHRLGSTRMPPKMEAEYQAREKARHKGLTYQPADAGGSKAGTAADAGAKPSEPKKLSYSDLPEGTKKKYDKEGLIKDHLPAPRPWHTYETHALKGNKANKESRKLRKHKKGKDKGSDTSPEKTQETTAPTDKEPASPAPAETTPAAAPAPKGD